MSEFTDAFEKFLGGWPKISRDDSRAVVRMIEMHNDELGNLRAACLGCATQIVVQEERAAAYADAATKWRLPLEYDFEDGAMGINGIYPGHLKEFVCSECLPVVMACIREANASRLPDKEAAAQAKREHEDAVYAGMVISGAFEQFEVARHRQTYEEIQRLKTVPYREFLASNYWKAIRRYAVHLANHQCALCDAKTGLNVHHRTYQHRAEEFNYMGDLIVLCGTCHARQHGKLEPEPKE